MFASALSESMGGFAPAVLPNESLPPQSKVQLKRLLLHGWNVNLSKFMECADRWSNGMVSRGSNHIPRFEEDDEDLDVIVELNGKC